MAESLKRELSLKSRELSAVAIGGGTGLPIILASLKGVFTNVSAIVTVADDGGSSGRLRRELGMPPPGDIRNCLVALANPDSKLASLFQYRFKEGSSLAEHSLGNLIIAALVDTTRDFAEAIEVASGLLSVEGQVLPSTLEDVTLVASVKSGALVSGQAKIARTPGLNFVQLEPPFPKAYSPAVQAIKEADLIILGPGSLFTSIIPNLLVENISEAILSSTGRKMYICNTVNQRHETRGLTATDHLDALLSHARAAVTEEIMVNDFSRRETLERLARQGIQPVTYDLDELNGRGVRVIVDDLADEDNPLHHDPAKLKALFQREVIHG